MSIDWLTEMAAARPTQAVERVEYEDAREYEDDTSSNEEEYKEEGNRESWFHVQQYNSFSADRKAFSIFFYHLI